MSCLDLSGAEGSLTNFLLGAHAAPATEEPGAQQPCHSTKETINLADTISKDIRVEKEASARAGTSSLAKPTNLCLLHVWGRKTVQEQQQEQVSA